MDTPKQNEPAKKATAAPGKKTGPVRLPSKPISFTGQPQSKTGKGSGKAVVNKSKKGGVNLMKKLSGM
jgi:hypothetical protein